MRMQLLTIAAVCLLMLLNACSKDNEGGNEGEGEGAGLEQSLNAVAEAAEAHALENGGLFAETTAPIYCRSGGSTTDPDSVFTTIGFAPSGDMESANFCFNVSGDRKKVSVSVSENPLAEEGLCLTIDLSSGEAVRSEITTTASCRP